MKSKRVTTQYLKICMSLNLSLFPISFSIFVTVKMRCDAGVDGLRFCGSSGRFPALDRFTPDQKAIKGPIILMTIDAP